MLQHNKTTRYRRENLTMPSSSWQSLNRQIIGCASIVLRSPPRSAVEVVRHYWLLKITTPKFGHGAAAHLAGGRGLSMRHGQYLKLGEKTPLANVFVTMLDRLKIPVESFADSSGEMSELLA
jgi:hypothetical protein